VTGIPCANARSQRFPRGAEHEIKQPLEIVRREERDAKLAGVFRREVNLCVRLKTAAQLLFDARDLRRSLEFGARRNTARRCAPSPSRECNALK